MKRISALVCLFAIGMLVYRGIERQEAERREQSLELRLNRIHHALSDFKKACGRYPLTHEGLIALSKKPPGALCSEYPKQGFVPQKAIMRDPWGSRYLYLSKGGDFILKSYGADGLPGGIGDERDRGFSSLALPVSVSDESQPQ